MPLQKIRTSKRKKQETMKKKKRERERDAKLWKQKRNEKISRKDIPERL